MDESPGMVAMEGSSLGITEEIKVTETEIRAEMGRNGGLERAKRMTAMERQESAKHAAKARWKQMRRSRQRKGARRAK